MESDGDECIYDGEDMDVRMVRSHARKKFKL